jgi:pre-mRNA-splicing factor ISY1
MVSDTCPRPSQLVNIMISTEWEEACANARGALGLPSDSPVPPFPLSNPTSITSTLAPSKTQKGKSKSKSKSSKQKPPDTAPASDAMDVDGAVAASDPQRAAADLLVKYAPFFSPEELMQPKLPTRNEMEDVLLQLRKRAVLDEYFGDEQQVGTGKA